MTFDALPRNHYGAILADPPWQFNCWADSDKAHGTANSHYNTMAKEDIARLPVADLAAKDCCLFVWICWPNLVESIETIEAWGFKYKTCAFSWMKADVSTINMFDAPVDAYMGLGYWTRANSEVCLLATRGKPKRLNADVRQGIIAPRREHSRKPDGIHERIERLVAGPYLELFARQKRPGWDCWGNETDKFTPTLSYGQSCHQP
jgi:N6-adenosine-specific RNA methylase IME4